VKFSEILINAVVQIIVSRRSNIFHSTNHEISHILLQLISSSRQFHIEQCASTVKILCKIAELPHGIHWLLKRSESSRKSRVSTLSSINSVKLSTDSGAASTTSAAVKIVPAKY